jgi:hypothetical protein
MVGCGASGGEEDVGVGMMLGVYHPKYGGNGGNNVRVLLFSLFIMHVSELTCGYVLLHLLWWVVDGKIILDSFVRVIAFVASWSWP